MVSKPMATITNLDDLGYCWFDTASLLVDGAKFEEAVKMCKSNNIEAGLHITLTEPRMSYCEFLWNYFNGGFSKEWIYQEIERQILEFKKSGLPLNRIDSHHGVHFFPSIWKILMILMRRHNIIYVRNPPRKFCWFNINPKIWISRNKSWLFYKINKHAKGTRPLKYKENICHLKS